MCTDPFCEIDRTARIGSNETLVADCLAMRFAANDRPECEPDADPVMLPVAIGNREGRAGEREDACTPLAVARRYAAPIGRSILPSRPGAVSRASLHSI